MKKKLFLYKHLDYVYLPAIYDKSLYIKKHFLLQNLFDIKSEKTKLADKKFQV